jgi:hypothetical protein
VDAIGIPVGLGKEARIEDALAPCPNLPDCYDYQ